ncbi:N-succinylarginine dihydrolase [Mangrovitalea sediminis]|uniref:N-succinylarginine dihydrolase n=1 Tax=Mangrovitalea sediminis TaxID=1982043 RepID=UPI000BE5A379|nr:N-succinylarginine dihydrolase [Mangrovitalea sediminis]
MKAVEANFDGLVGPTHNYAGLSWGNVASQTNVNAVSNPREAARQGLLKMKALADLGLTQGVLPPHERPHLPTLRRIGFSGSDAEVLAEAEKTDPVLLSAASSASCMWTANAATVSPSADTADGRVHFTPANLNAKFHRSIEHETTGRVLQTIFANPQYFAHHPALPAVSQFGDEGAANHTRLCAAYGEPGVELFVYGREAFNESAPRPIRYPARQTREACEAIARLHGLPERCQVLAQQNPEAIDAGVFHNDVIAVGNGNVLFYHERAFLDEEWVLTDIRGKLAGAQLVPIRVAASDVGLQDAVKSYLFNSQLLTRQDGRMLLVVPQECRDTPNVSAYLDALVADGGPIAEVRTFDLKQSMQNGGGPACLRLRVALNESELQAMHPGVMMTDALFEQLMQWVERYYRDRLSQKDLADPSLLRESREALDALTGILGLGSIYEFQR